MKTDEKIIKDFKKYIELSYIDYINKEVIKDYAYKKGLSEKEYKVLERRFL